MTSISFDLSKKTELRWLSDLSRQIGIAAKNVPFFMVGAIARDLLLQHVHGIHTGRETRDVDFAFLVETWDVFESIRSNLLATGSFKEAREVAHRLLSGALTIDLIPFGEIERADRTIAWPPDGTTVMSMIGFRETLATTVSIILPQKISVRVASLPALALLKLLAWEDRRHTQPRKDAYDLALVLGHYLDAGNRERLYSEAAELLKQSDFDYEAAGAWLMGHDISNLLAPAGRMRIARLLEQESNPGGPLNLVSDMPGETEKKLTLIRSLANGFLGKIK